MKKIEAINKVFTYLKYIKYITKDGYVGKTMIKSDNSLGLNPKSLIKHDLLTTFEKQVDRKKTITQCGWGGKPFNYVLAYDYYHIVRGKPERYSDIHKILSNPTTSDIDDYLIALEIKSAGDSLMNVTIKKPDIISESIVIITDTENKEQILPTKSQKDIDKAKFYVLMENIENHFEGNNKNQSTIIELFSDFSSIIIKMDGKIKSTQNSLSGLFSIIKLSQENSFIQTACLMNLVNAIRLMKKGDDDKVDEILGETMKYLRSQVNQNNDAIRKYGTYSNNVK